MPAMLNYSQKRRFPAFRTLPLLLSLSILLTGCSAFDGSYSVEEDFPLAAASTSEPSDSVQVSNLTELREAIHAIVLDGRETGTVRFSQNYDGNPGDDLAAAVWQLRTGDALCVYCVDSMSYEPRSTMNMLAAEIRVRYGMLPDKVHRLTYATGLTELISEAISTGAEELAVLIERSVLTDEAVSGLVTDVYRRDPALAPEEPEVEVRVFNGDGNQQLYEMTFHPGPDFAERKAALDEVNLPLTGTDRAKARQMMVILQPCYDEDAPGTVYDALVEGRANSEGIALAAVALCHRAGLDCRIVYGHKEFENHCWNIIRVDGDYYHLDVCSGIFLKSDAQMWESFRWTVADYPRCVTET